MTSLRWILAGLAAAAGITALAIATRRDAPPATPTAAPAVQALPLVLPPAQPTTASAASAQAPMPVTQPTTQKAAPAIGSEGYGPHIERAEAGTDPKAAWEAVQWLRLCATNEARRSSFETVRNQGVSPEMMTQLMVESDAEARRCQTVTPQHRALLPQLAARAMRAGVPEAASAYAGATFPGDLTPAQRLEVAEAMRRDARAGDLPSLLGALVANAAWGLDDTERLAYVYAYGTLGGQHAETVAMTLLKQGQIPLKSAPTPTQMAAAKTAGQEIVAHASRKP